jgi:hypothetical protein
VLQIVGLDAAVVCRYHVGWGKSYTCLALKLLQDVVLFVLSVFGVCCVNFNARESQGMHISVMEYIL